MKKVLALLTLAISVLGAPVTSAAAPILITGLRQAPGTLNPGVLREANNIVWQRLATVPGIQPISEAQVAQRLGPGYSAFATCAQDACMQQLGAFAGAAGVVWGFVQRTPTNGFVVYLRHVSVQTGQLVGSTQTGCNGCMEAEVLGNLMAMDPRPLNLAGPPRAALPPVATAQPAPAPQAPRTAAQAARPTTGLLTLESTPKGAQVFVGNRPVGVTPMKKVELPAGTHQFVLKKQYFAPATITAQVLPGESNVVKVTLQPTHALVTITSKPAGAAVSVNGQPVGTTPLRKVPVALGTYDLALVKDGYLPVREQLVISSGKAVKRTFRLKKAPPTTGFVSISSRPKGAKVSIDGKEVGTAPVKIELGLGEHDATLELPGYLRAARKFEIGPGKTTRLRVTLTKEPPAEGTLVLESRPKGAKVLVDGQEVGVTPTKVKVQRGKRKVKFEREGFVPVEKTVDLPGGKKVTLSVELDKAPPPKGMGLVEVKVKPKSAVVELGGKEFPPGDVPEQLVVAGTYDVRISAKGYEPLEFQVDVPEGKKVTVTRAMRKLPPPPKPGYLTVITKPAGATVQANGVEIGTTPIKKFKLDPGYYTIGIYLDGYADVEEEHQIKPRRTLTIRKKLVSRFAILKVTTTPPGATVFLDGEEKGTTPGTFSGLKGGTYKILVSKVGCREVLGEVTLKEGQVTKVHYDIEDAPGFLTLRVRPRKAHIFIDGKEVGTGSLTKHALEPGTHEIRITMDGYQDATGTVTIEKSKTKRIKFTLEEAKEQPAAKPDTKAGDEPAEAAPPERGGSSSTSPEGEGSKEPGGPSK